jgi:hypothetical protein
MAVIEGQWIAAVNQASHVTGSIHDEDRARELGFARAVVGAGMHIPLITRMAVDHFGAAWYERGFLKARFGTPMHEGDQVRIVLEDARPAESDELLLAMKLEKRDGSTPLTGFLGLLKSSDNPVAPWQRDGAKTATTNGLYDPLPLDDVGSRYTARPMVFETIESLPALRVVGDTCPWYAGASPWGGPILPTYRFVRLPRLASNLNPSPDTALDIQSSMNALFQVVHLGPVMCNRPYDVQATLVEKGYSGRTAFRTSEAAIGGEGRTVALVRQMLRWIPQRAMLRTA